MDDGGSDVTEKTQPAPQGVIAIMTNSTGDVIATSADFERQSYGGYKLWEAQKHRAREHVRWATVRAYCSSVMSSALSSYLMTQIADELCLPKGGHRITYRSIGYPEDIASEVERR
jgi:hypothetical protein